MNQRGLAITGTATRLLGGRLLSSALTPPDNVRVTFSHFVLDEHRERFAAIVRYLAADRNVIDAADFSRSYANGSRPSFHGRSLVMTFDDGLLSSYHAAQSVLNPLGIKAIFFIPTAIFELRDREEMKDFAWDRIYHRSVDRKELRPEQYVTMDTSHVRQLHGQGHVVFPHTHTHIRLSEVTTAAIADRELRQPKELLEDLLGSEVTGFSFPVGTERVVNAYAYGRVREIYSLCFTALAGANTPVTDPWFLHRDCVEASFSLARVRNAVDGVYDPYYRLKARRLRRATQLPAAVSTDGNADSHAASAAQNGSAQATRHDRRGDFVQRVADAFESAGIDHVFLHAYGRDVAADSDVDVAVSRTGLDVADALIRSGTFGRLVQRFDWGIPWGRYYVVRAEEPDRRYRQLDLICDPWGIGLDASAVGLALTRGTRSHGLRVPDAPAETLYLAVKRARKQMYRPQDQESLATAFARDPDGAARLLEHHFGKVGAALARALAERRDAAAELRSLRRSVVRERRRPARLVLRAFFSARRLLGRLARPTGLVVGLVGPDGAGKSTLATGLERRSRGAFRRTVRLHLRPGVLPPPSRILRRRAPLDIENPHGSAASGAVGSTARLVYLWLDTLVGWLPKVAGPRARSGLVLIERGWPDLAVDPKRYRLSLPPSVVRALGRFLPHADVVLVLSAPADVVTSRKQELGCAELERQARVWSSLVEHDPARFVAVDASAPAKDVLERALDVIDDRLAARQRSLSQAGLALACLGGLRQGGRLHTVVRARWGLLERFPRWILPARAGARGPMRTRLYRPANRKNLAGAVALEMAQALGGRALTTRVRVDPDRGIAPAIAESIGKDNVELAAAVTGLPSRGGRVLLSVLDRGHVVALAKVAREEGWKLERERDVLHALAACDLRRLVVPAVLDCFTWNDCVVLILSAIPTPGRALRTLAAPEVAGLTELGRLGRKLAGTLDIEPGLVPVHGDFAPWNSAALEDGRLALWDWEEARAGMPLEDLFHWRTQLLVRVGEGRPEDLVAGATNPDVQVRELAASLGVDPSSAPIALRACIERARVVNAPETGIPRRIPEMLARSAALLGVET